MNVSLYDLLCVIGVIIASCSQILLKKSANRTYGNAIKEYCNVLVIGGYGLMVLSTIFGVLAYRGMNYMNGPIIETLGYVIVIGLSYKVFGEKINRRKLIGTGFILMGIILYYI